MKRASFLCIVDISAAAIAVVFVAVKLFPFFLSSSAYDQHYFINIVVATDERASDFIKSVFIRQIFSYKNQQFTEQKTCKNSVKNSGIFSILANAICFWLFTHHQYKMEKKALLYGMENPK